MLSVTVSKSRKMLKAFVPFAFLLSPLVRSEVLFEENFDSQPDWTSGMAINDRGGLPDGPGPDTVQCIKDGHVLPKNWDCARQDPQWAPSVGYPNRHENLEIVDRNADKARGGSGKSLVVWRDSTSGPEYRWNSDGILSKNLGDGYRSLYVRFWIKLDPKWTPLGETGITKLFRISSYDGAGELYTAFSDGNSSAILLWDYENNKYGVRNTLSFRGDPQETNYNIKSPAPIDFPREINNGDVALNFTDNVIDLNGDSKPDQQITSLTNLVTGQLVDPEAGTLNHEELWGRQWHKVEFYVQMNSAPGAMDGIIKQWFDNQLIFKNESFPWMGYDSKGGVLWNFVHFGGNSHFHAYPDSEMREEWFSIDDILIRTDIPNNRENSDYGSLPKPPYNIIIK